MLAALETIARHEQSGRIGAPATAVPTATREALHARDWIEPTIDGGRKLTHSGWDVLREHGVLVEEKDMLNRNPDVFDLDAEGIALPGNAIRLLGEYAQGNGPAKALYVKATDHELASVEDINMAVAELQRQNERLNSSELDRLVRELQQIAQGDDVEDADDGISFDLSEKEEESLRYIASKYESAQILYDAYDPAELMIPRGEAIRAFFATPGDGGDLGTVPLAGGTLKKKIEQLWADAEAWEEWERADQEGRHEEDQD